jgi:hypothetical protein
LNLEVISSALPQTIGNPINIVTAREKAATAHQPQLEIPHSKNPAI